MNQGLIIDDSLETLNFYSAIAKSIFPSNTFLTANSVDDALTLLDSEDIDAVIYASNIVDDQYLKNIAQVKAASPNSIVISVNNCEVKSVLNKVFNCGANGCILASESPQELIRLFSALTFDIAPISPKVLDIITSEQKQTSIAKPAHLTNREYDVFDLLCKGLSNKAIAKSLKLSAYTIADHVKSILNKMNVHNRSELIKQSLNIH